MKLTSTLGVTDTFVQAHAAVLLEWEGIEHHLLVIFSALVRAASPEVSSTAFHRATTLKTRLTMIDAAARVFLKDGDLYLEWRALSDRVSAEAKHSGLALFASVQNTHPGKEISPPFESTGHEVAANPNDVNDLRQIRQWRDGFRSLAADLHGFLARVENALAIAGAPPPLSEV